MNVHSFNAIFVMKLVENNPMKVTEFNITRCYGKTSEKYRKAECVG
ncbi:hypothetical protein KCTC52924_03273 [Arenibacter antarcticus]